MLEEEEMRKKLGALFNSSFQALCEDLLIVFVLRPTRKYSNSYGDMTVACEELQNIGSLFEQEGSLPWHIFILMQGRDFAVTQ